jgi:hypothetical protein
MPQGILPGYVSLVLHAVGILLSLYALWRLRAVTRVEAQLGRMVTAFEAAAEAARAGAISCPADMSVSLAGVWTLVNAHDKGIERLGRQITVAGEHVKGVYERLDHIEGLLKERLQPRS